VVQAILGERQHAEIIVERMIFLHRDDDMVHLREAIRARLSRRQIMRA
jgi:hypothetical protein